MAGGVFSALRIPGLAFTGGARPFCSRGQRGSVLFYIFMAIALLAALTYSFTRDSRDNVSGQMANKISQELYVEINTIRSAIMECALAYPAGGGDLNADDLIDSADNPNNPFPLNPSDGVMNSLNPSTAFADDNVRNLACITAVDSKKMIFQGLESQGRFLPPPPPGYSEWTYANDADGVRIMITPGVTATDVAAMARLLARFDAATCQATFTGGVFTVWLQKAACP